MPADVYGQLPGPWWKKFEALNKQPRPSKREEAGVRHIQDWAQSLGFQTERDSACNLAVHVPASPGFERSEPVCLQAHVDMVIAKRPGAPPDVDPEHGRIPVERASLDASGKPVSDPSGPYLWAPHSTLGADDGIGCVMGMVLCEDQSAVRPPIKLLITIDEEEGMSGADGVDVEQLKLTNVRRLINLDSEDDREVTIGGAGGLDSTLTLNRKTSPLDRQKYALWTIAIDHLMGGHSGLEIHKSRANAIRLCARIVASAQIAGLRLLSIQGGDKRNAIPRWCHATVAVPSEHAAAFEKAARTAMETLRKQFAGRDNDLQECVKLEEFRPSGDVSALTDGDTRTLVNLLLALPHGVLGMTPELPQLPETSSNLALISTTDGTVVISCSSRSSLEPALDEVAGNIAAIAALGSAEVNTGARYRGWRPNPKSPLLKLTADLYREMFREEPIIHAVHAGLECGVLSARFPRELDCVSIGPTIRGNHAPGEMVEIASVAKSYQLLKELVSRIAQGG